MHAPFRLYLQTTGGGFFVTAANLLTQLPALTRVWFVNTPNGRSVSDDIIQYVVVMALNPDTGAYERESITPANSRLNVIQKLEVLARS